MADTIPYAGANVTFLDRDSGEKRAITYPITDIELLEYHSTPTGTLVATRRFTVERNAAGDDVWVEKPATGPVMDTPTMHKVLGTKESYTDDDVARMAAILPLPDDATTKVTAAIIGDVRELEAKLKETISDDDTSELTTGAVMLAECKHCGHRNQHDVHDVANRAILTCAKCHATGLPPPGAVEDAHKILAELHRLIATLTRGKSIKASVQKAKPEMASVIDEAAAVALDNETPDKSKLH